MILFIGAPLSGKSTVTEILERTGKCIRYSSSEQVRKHHMFGEDPGFKKAMDEGDVKEFQIYDQVVEEFIEKHKDQEKVLIFEGYPRTFKQAENLKKKANVKKVIIIEISYDECLKRLKNRKKKEQREDDQTDILFKRYENYKKNLSDIKKVFNDVQILKFNHKEYNETRDFLHAIIRGTNVEIDKETLEKILDSYPFIEKRWNWLDFLRAFCCL